MNLEFKENLDFAVLKISSIVLNPEVWITFEEFSQPGLRHWTRIKLRGKWTEKSHKLFKKL